MSSAVDPVRRVQALIDLQVEFSAATEAMNQAWAIYRKNRTDAAALYAYTAATDRCQELKVAIYQFKVAGRLA